MAYLQGCLNIASVGERLIVGAEKRTRWSAEGRAPTAGLSRNAVEAEERFDRLAVGFGYMEACLLPGTSTAEGLIDVPPACCSDDQITFSGGFVADHNAFSDASHREFVKPPKKSKRLRNRNKPLLDPSEDRVWKPLFMPWVASHLFMTAPFARIVVNQT